MSVNWNGQYICSRNKDRILKTESGNGILVAISLSNIKEIRLIFVSSSYRS